MGYAALAAAWTAATTPPEGVTGASLAGLSTEQKINIINGWTVAGAPADVPVRAVAGYLSTNLKIAALINYAASPPGESIAASVGVAQNLVAVLTKITQPPDFEVSNPAILEGLTAALAQLVSDPLCGLTADDEAALLALSHTTIPWWQAVGLTSPISAPDLEVAGGLS